VSSRLAAQFLLPYHAEFFEMVTKHIFRHDFGGLVARPPSSKKTMLPSAKCPDMPTAAPEQNAKPMKENIQLCVQKYLFEDADFVDVSSMADWVSHHSTRPSIAPHLNLLFLR
jgi:hypothetical protein